MVVISLETTQAARAAVCSPSFWWTLVSGVSRSDTEPSILGTVTSRYPPPSPVQRRRRAVHWPGGTQYTGSVGRGRRIRHTPTPGFRRILLPSFARLPWFAGRHLHALGEKSTYIQSDFTRSKLHEGERELGCGVEHARRSGEEEKHVDRDRYMSSCCSCFPLVLLCHQISLRMCIIYAERLHIYLTPPRPPCSEFE